MRTGEKPVTTYEKRQFEVAEVCLQGVGDLQEFEGASLERGRDRILIEGRCRLILKDHAILGQSIQVFQQGLEAVNGEVVLRATLLNLSQRLRGTTGGCHDGGA